MLKEKLFSSGSIQIAFLFFVGLLLLAADFLSKAYIYNLMPFSQSQLGVYYWHKPVFHGVLGIDFSITLTTNRGAAWGIFAGHPAFLVVIRILMTLGLLIFLLIKERPLAINLPLVFILSGAIGNIIDFFIYGFVVDFLHFIFWGFDFPVFNLADTFITIGVVWLLLHFLFRSKKKHP